MGNNGVSCVICHPLSSPWPAWFIALVSLGCFVWLFFNSLGRGGRWNAALVGGAVFGYLVEYLNTQTGSGHIYCYAPAPGLNLFGVPWWVALGWGSIIYASTWTAELLRLPRLGQAIAAAFLAASVDFSLDPIAELFGFWQWQCFDVNFLYVPYDNYLGWYLIVFVYTLISSWLLNLNTQPGQPPPSGGIQWGIAFVCAGIAMVTLLAVKAGLGAVTPLGADNGKTAAAIFIITTVVGGFVTFYLGRLPVTVPSPPINWAVIVVPGVIHLACYVLFLSTGFTFSPFAFVGWTHVSSLVASIPIQALSGLFIFTTPWRR